MRGTLSGRTKRSSTLSDTTASEQAQAGGAAPVRYRKDPPCVDLRQFDPPYRIHNEPEDRPAREYDKAWDLIIRGARGFVAPYGGEYLLACTRSGQGTSAVLAKVPGAVVTQQGTEGANIKIRVEDLDAVADIFRLYRRREVSDAERDRLARLGEAYRFPPGHGVQSQGEGPRSGEASQG